MSLMRTPVSAPRPVPTMIATGVARPREQGQAMMRTATAATRPAVGLPAKSHQAAKVAAAIPRTAGTKTAEIRSARRCTGALEPWASATRRTIWASAVSAPTALARMVRTPFVFTVAPATFAPSALSTGADSPVSIDSSTAEKPETTTPSTGTFSPGRTRTRSPTITCSTGTIRSVPSTTTRACLAPSSSSFLIAPEARPLAFASKYRPRMMKAMISAAVSKYRSPPAASW